MKEDIKINQELLYRYKIDNDEGAFEELITHNTPLIYGVIKKYFSTIFNDAVDEFYDLGMIGLIKAIKTFDEKRIDEVAFSTYATSLIRNEIFASLDGRNKSVGRINFHNIKFTSIYNPVIEKKIYSESEIEQVIEKDDLEYRQKRVLAAIERIDDAKRKYIIRSYFGFNDDDPLPVREIAKRLNCSKVWVYKSLKKGLNILKKELREFSI